MRSGSQRFAGGIDNESSKFVIKHEKLDLGIYLSALNLLLLHEETIPDAVTELKDSFLHDGVVKDPVVVDADSLVVLDGMHRVAALRELQCLCVPVCAVDYLNPSVRVGVWYRTLSGQSSLDQFEAALSSSGIRFERFSVDVAKILEDAGLTAMFASGQCFGLKSNGLEIYEVLKIAERCAREIGLTIRFETERDALEKLVKKETDAIMTLPKIDKRSVRQAGLTGRLLPHKVTRHIIPARPLGVNVPLMTLTDGTVPLQEANRLFVASLRARGIARRPSGTVIDGRRYEEETFIFN